MKKTTRTINKETPAETKPLDQNALEMERIEAVREAAGQTVRDLQKRVDALLEKIIAGQADDKEKRKASVLAKVILDRSGHSTKKEAK